jgi:hypothetical protein
MEHILTRPNEQTPAANITISVLLSQRKQDGRTDVEQTHFRADHEERNEVGEPWAGVRNVVDF